jgi:hypothetical protein
MSNNTTLWTFTDIIYSQRLVILGAMAFLRLLVGVPRFHLNILRGFLLFNKIKRPCI